MDKTIEQVKQLAHRCRVPKLVLFGSRARGDHHARSDYDFAVWGCTPQQRAQFSDAVENDLDSLYSVDLVFVSEHTDAALLQNIEKDGICLLDRYNTNFENLTNAVERLHEGVQAYQENPAKIIRDGVIQRFEFKAFSYGLIDDEQAWIALLNARNQTSHLYDDATAQEIYSQIESEFISLFDKLIEQLKRG